MSRAQVRSSIFEGIDEPPVETDLHYYADWMELLALADTDGRVVGDFVAQLMRNSSGAAGSAPGVSDPHAAKAAQVFGYVIQRDAMFGSSYPFDIDRTSGRSVLIRRPDIAADAAKRLYVLLLLCSCLRYASKTAESELAKDFEVLSRIALEAYLPPRATVHIFGTASGRVEAVYTGNLANKLRQLGEQIKETPLEDHLQLLSPYNTGDAGIDLVAWLDPLDDQRGRLITFGQAAATPEWRSKRESASYSKMKQIFSPLAVPTTNVCVVPFCIRNAKGDWYQPIDHGDSIMLDRLRIIRLLTDDASVGRRAEPVGRSFVDAAISSG